MARRSLKRFRTPTSASSSTSCSAIRRFLFGRTRPKGRGRSWTRWCELGPRARRSRPTRPGPGGRRRPKSLSSATGEGGGGHEGASMIGESRSAPYGGAMSAAEIERELARLRMNEDGTLGARASVLNLIVVTNEDYAAGVTRVVSELSESYPSRVVLLISDPDEKEPNLEVGLSAFCGLRRGMPGRGQVCAEQIKIHVEGPPARHLESLAGPLLIPDLPVFLWYPNGDIPRSPECDGMAVLADRLVLDSGATADCEASLRKVANLLGEGIPAVGDLQWAALSPWRSLIADLFAPPERAGELAKIRCVEILHHGIGECQAFLLAGWLSWALGWRPQTAERTEEGRMFGLASPSG